MSVIVNLLAAYNGYFTKKAISAAEFDFSLVVKEISHFPAMKA